VQAVFATHVDTSTGVRLDVRALAALTRARGVLSVLDSVCAVGGEVCEQAAWDIDVVLAASQKALGAAPGLALLVVSPRALDARRDLRVPPPLFLDLEEWLPVHHALEGGVPSYFATPPTSLVRALATALGELDVAASVAQHARVAAGLRAAWRHLGLALVPDEADAANTLSALWIPNGVETQLPRRVAEQGVLVAGALHPALRPRSFRVGHMGFVTRRPDLLERCVRAIGNALADSGRAVDIPSAVAALHGSEREVDRDRVATGRH
jgi:alanine-glyoxylate transaminase/serine-glyoxylate transaminase/serine-pyruvate transaminase